MIQVETLRPDRCDTERPALTFHLSGSDLLNLLRVLQIVDNQSVSGLRDEFERPTVRGIIDAANEILRAQQIGRIKGVLRNWASSQQSNDLDLLLQAARAAGVGEELL